jgi:hypothetical protein
VATYTYIIRVWGLWFRLRAATYTYIMYVCMHLSMRVSM